MSEVTLGSLFYLRYISQEDLSRVALTLIKHLYFFPLFSNSPTANIPRYVARYVSQELETKPELKRWLYGGEVVCTVTSQQQGPGLNS